ncbi:MAG: hypothetical protein MUO61_03460 [Dehalococcoidia bacterium]|nr:hypothetical protein [Dehalococcoidia bacterium]
MAKVLIVAFLVGSLIFTPGGVATETAETYDASKVSLATRQEVQDFLTLDATNETAYNKLQYNCLNFAVDLWHNAYLAGFDAFIIVLNKDGLDSHVVLGFYAIGNEGYAVDYWGENKQWFYIDPQKDSIIGRGDDTDPLDKRNVEIITFLYGEDAFELWEEVSGGGSKIPLISLYETVGVYKVKKLFTK